MTIFSFRGIAKAEFCDFLFNDNHLQEIDNVNSNLKVVLKELWISEELSNELFNEIIKCSKSSEKRIYLQNEDNKNKDETTFYRTLFKCLLYSSLDRDFKDEIEDFLKDQIDFAKAMNSGYTFAGTFLFRGKSDYSWKISPSLIRNLSVDKDLCINQNTLFNMNWFC